MKESGPLSVPCADVAHKPVLGVRNKNMRIVRFFYFINSKGYLVREGEQIGISRDIDVQDPEMIGGTQVVGEPDKTGRACLGNPVVHNDLMSLAGRVCDVN